MKKLILLFCGLLAAATATAQATACAAPSIWVCTSDVAYTYDAVGNRIARSRYCYCQSPTSRYAKNATARDSTAAATVANNDAVSKGIAAIYPNPTSNSITVEFTETVTTATVAISNELGQEAGL